MEEEEDEKKKKTYCVFMVEVEACKMPRPC
jgi:hypothetical protein